MPSKNRRIPSAEQVGAMKRLALFIPFVAAMGALAGVVLTPEGPVKNLWFLASFFSVASCWLVVPLLSRRSLTLGYLGLLLPVVLIVIAAILDHKQPLPQQTPVEQPAVRKP